MNHKWDENNKCKVCGVERERRTQKLCMAVVNHPPWNVYKYEWLWAYSFDLKKWTFRRPNCNHQQLTNGQ